MCVLVLIWYIGRLFEVLAIASRYLYRVTVQCESAVALLMPSGARSRPTVYNPRKQERSTEIAIG